jgi:D-aspartate ligase
MRTFSETVIVVYSHIVGLAVIRALGRMGIPIVVLHYLPVEMGYVSKYVRQHYRITAPTIDEESFISDILALADLYPGALLVPTDDYTVVALSKNKERLKKNFRVAVQDWGVVKRIVKKQYTYELAEQIGVPYPRTAVCESLDDVEKRIRDFQFPCLLKPCEGHQFFDIFRKKVLVVGNARELRTRYQELQNLKITVMLQEIIPGEVCEGVNYISYLVDGEPIAEFTAEKVRVDPPFFGSPRVIVSKKIPQIIEPARKLLKALGYEGFSCIEFKRDVRDGVYKLMEINARHNLSGSLAVACGIDFPRIMYRDLVEGKKEYGTDFRENIYWIDLNKDVMRFFVSRKAEGYSINQYLTPYLHKHIYGILDIQDPLPFVKRCADIVKMAVLSPGHAHYS